MKIMTVFGTRPEAIKLAPLIKAFEKDHAIEHLTCVTAQHRSMLDQVLETFEIEPNFDLDLMQDNQDLGTLSAHILSKVTPLLKEHKPDFVLVQGDTVTVLMAALAAYYAQSKFSIWKRAFEQEISYLLGLRKQTDVLCLL
jgi:UDP-N-acetylglucosamine 2-epimerase (non-hydrolysing)